MPSIADKIIVHPPYKSIVDFVTVEPATVNWPALGSVTPEVALEFARALAERAREAQAMNLQIVVK